MANEPAAVQMVHAVRDAHGRIDALLNNAGVASMNALVLTPQSSARALFETNVLGTFVFLREAAKAMIRQKSGRIVNFSTVAVPLASSRASPSTIWSSPYQ